MPIFNQTILQSFVPMVLLCIILSLTLTLLKWRAGQWTMLIAITNAILQSVGTIVFILIVIHPDFIHSASIPYIAAITETTSAKVAFTIDKILLVSMIIAVLANAFDIYQGFKKLKYKFLLIHVFSKSHIQIAKIPLFFDVLYNDKVESILYT